MQKILDEHSMHKNTPTQKHLFKNTVDNWYSQIHIDREIQVKWKCRGTIWNYKDKGTPLKEKKKKLETDLTIVLDSEFKNEVIKMLT